jgi:hypothetical protein
VTDTSIEKIRNRANQFATKNGYVLNGVKEELAAIDRAAGPATVWIDLETGVRTNDELDMKKVETVLAAASKYV